MRKVVAFGLILALGGIARADTVKLKNGAVATGTVIEANGHEVRLDSDHGTFVFPRSKVESITYDERTESSHAAGLPEETPTPAPKSSATPTEANQPTTPAPDAATERAEPEPRQEARVGGPSDRPIRFFASLDLFTRANGMDKFEQDFKDTINELGATVGPTSGSAKFTGGAGARVGLLFSNPNGWELGPSVGLISGPSEDGNADTATAFGNFHTHVKIETSFLRGLLEARKRVRLSPRAWIRLGVGAGYARGKIKDNIDITGAGTGSSSGDESWGGFTWEVSPAVIFDVEPVSVEFGVRYAHFPKKDISDKFDEFEWDPFGFFAGLLF